MAAQVLGIERRSPTGSTDPDKPSQQVFVVKYAAAELDHTVALADVTTYRTANSLTSLDGKPFSHYDYSTQNDDLYRVTAIYQKPSYGTPAAEEGDVEFRLNTIGKSQKVLTTLARQDSQAPTGYTVPTVGDAIGATETGIEGVDAPFPAFDFTVTNIVSAATATPSYYASIRAASAKVNNASVNTVEFGTLAAGELLFLGARATKSQNGDLVRVEFEFSALPNATSVEVGGMTFATKEGWDHLWLMFADETDGAARGKKPIAGFIDRYIERYNFALLPVNFS